MTREPHEDHLSDEVERTAERGMPSRRDVLKRAAGILVLVVVVVLAVGALPGLDEVRDRFSRADGRWIAVTALCAFGSVVSYVFALRGSLERRVPWKPAWWLGLAEQGGNVLVPAGGVSGPALGSLLMRRAGVPAEVAVTRSAALFLLTSAVSFAALVVFGLACWSGVLPADAGWVGTLLPALVAAAVLGGAVAVGLLPCGDEPGPSHPVAQRLQRIRRLLVTSVRTSLGLLRGGDPLLIGGIVGYLAFDIAAVGAAFEAFGGGGPSLGPFVLAYVLGQAGALIPTPGGIGGTDGGLVAMFVVYGAPASLAAAAVIAYRLFQLGFPVVLGVLAFNWMRRRLRDGPPAHEIAARYAPLVRTDGRGHDAREFRAARPDAGGDR